MFHKVPTTRRIDSAFFESDSAWCQEKGLKILSDNRLVTISRVQHGTERNCSVLHVQLSDIGFDEYDDREKDISCRLTKEAAFFDIEGKFYRMSFGASFEQREFKEHGYTKLEEINEKEYPSYRHSSVDDRDGTFLDHTPSGIREVAYNYEYIMEEGPYMPITVEGYGTYLTPTPKSFKEKLHRIGDNVINVRHVYPRILSSDFELHFPDVSCIRQIIGVYNDGSRTYIVAATPWDISVTWISYEEKLATAV